MKSIAKRLIAAVVSNDIAWAAINVTIIRFANYASMARRDCARRKLGHLNTDSENTESELLKISPDLNVLHGPFKGMRYPGLKSVGSTLAPKIIGSYEKELHPILERICRTPYTEIIDVGCAEGFYAVGLAMRISSARVFAFDTDATALLLCEQMARLNRVFDRITFGSFCTSEALARLPLTDKALIISDCEGYEKQLFDESVVPILARHDLLIEIHDFIDLDISQALRSRFTNTHRIEVVQSIDDVYKMRDCPYEELVAYSLKQKRQLLAENRPHIMEWFFLTPL